MPVINADAPPPEKLGIPIKLQELGIDEARLKSIVDRSLNLPMKGTGPLENLEPGDSIVSPNSLKIITANDGSELKYVSIIPHPATPVFHDEKKLTYDAAQPLISGNYALVKAEG